MALGALRELKRHDLDVPGDVSLGGFDDIRTASYLHPSLTTVRVPMYELGREGFFLALRMLAGEQPPVRRLPVGLQVRESTGPPPDRVASRPAHRSSMIGSREEPSEEDRRPFHAGATWTCSRSRAYRRRP